jgi:radical SAM-linked protein
VCDFDQLKMRYADSNPNLTQQPAPPQQGDERYKLRLRLHKTGNARYVSHLEFMTVLQRAIKRSQMPLRFSLGFHPHPCLSFPDALPTGVQSHAEIVDIELFLPYSAELALEQISAELPEGFAVASAQAVHWRTPSPGACIISSDYLVPLHQSNSESAQLQHDIEQFMAADRVEYQRHQGDKVTTIELRSAVKALKLEERGLLMTLTKGSPIAVAAQLLNLDAAIIRTLGICKTDVSLIDLPKAYPN